LTSGGLFVTLYLTISHYRNLDVACGGSGGCTKVLTSSYANIGPIPVAVIGLLGYLLLGGFGMARILGPVQMRPLLTKLGLIVSSFGLAASAIFIFISIDIIGDTCKWCLASATIMALLFFSHLMLSRNQDSEPRARRPELPNLIACAIVVLAVIPVRMMDLNQAKVESEDIIQKGKLPDSIDALIPKGAHTEGPDNAPVTIVEFGDLTCPHCKEAYDIFDAVMKQSGGNIRFVFRHYPLYNLQGHQYALITALISEMAAEKGQFWQFVKEMYSVEDAETLTEQDIDQMAQKVGLDPAVVAKRSQDTNDPIYKAVLRDMNDGRHLGVQGTPTLIIAFKGSKPFAGKLNTVEEALAEPPYSKYVKGL
jgi:protein-disulfide isomerase